MEIEYKHSRRSFIMNEEYIKEEFQSLSNGTSKKMEIAMKLSDLRDESDLEIFNIINGNDVDVHLKIDGEEDVILKDIVNEVFCNTPVLYQ